MPGYGLKGADEGSGLLSWAAVAPMVAASHDYWLATTYPDGRPHVMPVWGVWDGSYLWFSSSVQSRKVRNLHRDPRCVATTDDALDPVVLEGTASFIAEPDGIAHFLGLLNAKYRTSYGLDFLDPAKNACVRIRPVTAFALLASDFTGSPTRWTFP